jgi:hypothetical protein
VSPSELRALLGHYLIPGVRVPSVNTIRFKVLGFGIDTVRVQSTNGARSTLPLVELETAIERALLVRED